MLRLSMNATLSCSRVASVPLLPVSPIFLNEYRFLDDARDGPSIPRLADRACGSIGFDDTRDMTLTLEPLCAGNHKTPLGRSGVLQRRVA